MPNFTPGVLVVIAVFATALAQVLLKKASHFEVRTMSWILYMGLSAVIYGFSFVLYSRILKYFALNKIYPAMTVGQIAVVTVAGLFLGEAIGGRHAVGLVLGAVAIYLILS
jgi:uncharacterized membrane protein